MTSRTPPARRSRRRSRARSRCRTRTAGSSTARTWTERIVEGIAATGKPVAGFSIEGNGELEIVRQACWAAIDFVQQASEQQRERIELSELTVSIKCGESDTTTGLGSRPTRGAG